MKITGVCRLNRRVYESLSAAHSVEEELSGIKPGVKTVLHEAFSGGVLGIPLEMGQTPLGEAVGDPLSTDGLLPDTGNHLAQVDIGALGAAEEHLQRRVVGGEFLPADVAHFVSDLAERAVHEAFQRLFGVTASLVLQTAVLVGKDQFVAFLVPF
jgi:hypothetical protein